MIRLAFRCRAEDAERVLAALLELAPGGVEEEWIPDPAARGREAREAAGTVEFAIYGAPGELPELPDLIAEDGRIEVTTSAIPDDWADRWRDFHRPVVVGDGRLVVRPSWREPMPAASSASRPGATGVAAGAVDIVIEPGQAFGTGAHATTRMCLELLLALSDAGRAEGSLVDLGTGSGVLAIAAAKLGWGPVTGVDHQDAALEAAQINAAANDVGLDLRRVNLREQPPPLADTVIANLTGPLLRDVAERLREPLPAALVCSGAIASEAEAVAAGFGAAGFTEASRVRDGDWVAISFDRP